LRNTLAISILRDCFTAKSATAFYKTKPHNPRHPHKHRGANQMQLQPFSATNGHFIGLIAVWAVVYANVLGLFFCVQLLLGLCFVDFPVSVN